jgi:hypothetical protein
MEECAIYLAFNFFFQAKFPEAQEKSTLAWRSACIRGDLQMQVYGSEMRRVSITIFIFIIIIIIVVVVVVVIVIVVVVVALLS